MHHVQKTMYYVSEDEKIRRQYIYRICNKHFTSIILYFWRFDMNSNNLVIGKYFHDSEVKEIAKKNFPNKQGWNPVTDGVGNEKAYLESTLRIMFILKEPYDEVDENGQPYGGAWDIVKESFF